MWEVDNGTPFSAAGYFVRDRDGFEHWAVAVRARFGLQPDGLPVIVDQRPVRMAPEYADDDASELAAEADLSPFRPRPDVILRGEAHPSADGGYTRMLTLRIGETEKRVQAFGPRRARRLQGRWRVERRPFIAFGLSWKRSLGGRDVLGPDEHGQATHPGNPIGAGWSPRMTAAPDGVEFDLPQLERPDDLLHPGRPSPAPVGFGAVQPAWEPRAGRAGTYDELGARAAHPSFLRISPRRSIRPRRTIRFTRASRAAASRSSWTASDPTARLASGCLRCSWTRGRGWARV